MNQSEWIKNKFPRPDYQGIHVKALSGLCLNSNADVLNAASLNSDCFKRKNNH